MNEKPPITIAHVLNLDPRRLRAWGTVNIRVDRDNPFYIDPRLLRQAKTPELRGAFDDVDKRFDDTLLLLWNSKRRGDGYWKRAEALTRFREPPGLCLGWGEKSTRGRGVGAKLRRDLLDAAKDSLSLGKIDVRLFEFLLVLESGISHDRISDIASSIIYRRLLAYSQRVYKGLGVEGAPFVWEDETFSLPVNPDTRHPIVLVPKEILALLPKGGDHAEIIRMCDDAEALRTYFNRTLGKRWKSHVDAGILRKAVLGNETLLQSALQSFSRAKPKPYNFKKDPRGLYKPLNDALAVVHDAPLKFQVPAGSPPDKVLSAVLAICEAFKTSVENRGAHRLLVIDGKGRPEKAVQDLFYAIATEHCRANKYDISPETNAGRGSVDFKLSQGSNSKVLVEIKLATSQDLEHGFDVQLTEYAKAEQTWRLVYLVVDYGDNEAATTRLAALRARATGPIQIIEVRAVAKKPASKYKPEPETIVAIPDLIADPGEASIQARDGENPTAIPTEPSPLSGPSLPKQ